MKNFINSCLNFIRKFLKRPEVLAIILFSFPVILYSYDSAQSFSQMWDGWAGNSSVTGTKSGNYNIKYNLSVDQTIQTPPKFPDLNIAPTFGPFGVNWQADLDAGDLTGVFQTYFFDLVDDATNYQFWIDVAVMIAFEAAMNEAKAQPLYGDIQGFFQLGNELNTKLTLLQNHRYVVAVNLINKGLSLNTMAGSQTEDSFMNGPEKALSDFDSWADQAMLGQVNGTGNPPPIDLFQQLENVMNSTTVTTTVQNPAADYTTQAPANISKTIIINNNMNGQITACLFALKSAYQINNQNGQWTYIDPNIMENRIQTAVRNIMLMGGNAPGYDRLIIQKINANGYNKLVDYYMHNPNKSQVNPMDSILYEREFAYVGLDWFIHSAYLDLLGLEGVSTSGTFSKSYDTVKSELATLDHDLREEAVFDATVKSQHTGL